MSFRDSKLFRYFKTVGAGSLAISVGVHALLVVIAIGYVVSVTREERKIAFRGNGTADGGARGVEHRVTMARQQTRLSDATRRLSVDTPSAEVSLPDLPDMPSLTGGPATLGKNFAGGGNGGPGPAGLGAGNSLLAPRMPAFGLRKPSAHAPLTGILYDLKQSTARQPLQMGKNQFAKTLDTFLASGWKTDVLKDFYRAPEPLYTTQVFIPVIEADAAPKQFGVEKEVQPMFWLVHYRGKISAPAGGAWRFWGYGEEVCAVAIDGKTVLVSNWADVSTPTVKWTSPEPPGAPAAKGRLRAGDWIETRTGQVMTIDILIGERAGGVFAAYLLIERKGETYAKNDGHPVLPVFKLAPSDTPSPPAISDGPAITTTGPIWKGVK